MVHGVVAQTLAIFVALSAIFSNNVREILAHDLYSNVCNRSFCKQTVISCCDNVNSMLMNILILFQYMKIHKIWLVQQDSKFYTKLSNVGYKLFHYV